MKKLSTLLLLTFLPFACLADVSDCRIKRAENAKIIGILKTLNEASDFTKENSGKNFSKSGEFSELVNSVKEPMQMAKLIVLCHYLAYPESAGTEAIDANFNAFGISLMGRFKDSEDFAEAMKFVERAISMDAGESVAFMELIWEARDSEKIKENFKPLIVKWTQGIREHGSAADRELLKQYEAANPQVFKKAD